ncbi:MAG: DUF4252 domain-containing protein [Chitinophagaceae bacterium]
MKKLFALLLLFTVKFSFSQEMAADKYYKDFQEKHSLDMVSVSSKMFSVFLQNRQGKEKEELATILKKLTGLKVLSKDDSKNGLDLYNAAFPLMPADYETILIMKETDRKARFYTKEDKSGKITELVMIAFQWGRFLIVSITGDIDLNDILKLSQNLNLQGLDDVQKVRSEKQ